MIKTVAQVAKDLGVSDQTALERVQRLEVLTKSLIPGKRAITVGMADGELCVDVDDVFADLMSQALTN